jgi:subtilisin family serine protease
MATQGTRRIKAMLLSLDEDDSNANIAKAIDHAAQRGARIINLSLGLHGKGAELDVLKAAVDRHPDVLFVHAAGNYELNFSSWPNKDYYFLLDERHNAAAIAAADRDGRPGDITNYGAPYVTHAALGDAHATDVGERFGASPGTFTSFAAPSWVNVAAKCLLLRPSLTPKQLKAILAASADSRAEWQGKVAAGGPTNARRAYLLAGLLNRLDETDGDPVALARGLGIGDEEQTAVLAALHRYRTAR